MSLLSNLTQRLRETLSPTTMPAATPELAASAAAAVRFVVDGLPELLAVAVVDLATGRSLSSHSGREDFQASRAALHNSEVVKQTLAALQAPGLADEKLEDILITLRSQLHVLRLTAKGQHFVYLAVERDTTNLAIARQVLREASALVRE